MMAIAGKIKELASLLIAMITSNQTATGNGCFPRFTAIPLSGDLRLGQGTIVDVHFGQLAFKIPAAIEVHSKSKRMNFVVVARIGPGADLPIIEIKRHRLVRARDDRMMPFAIAKLLRT